MTFPGADPVRRLMLPRRKGECAALTEGAAVSRFTLPADDGLNAAVVIERRTCPCCRGERPDPGRDPDCRAAARGSTTAPGCRGWDRASRGFVAAVPRGAHRH